VTRSPERSDRRAPSFMEGVLEACWLAAVVVIPVLFNVHSETIFEAEKAAVLRSLLLLLVVVGLIWIFRSGRPPRERIQALWRSPLGIAWTLTLASYLLATALSIDPRLSLWGSFIRRQGLFTALAYLALFLAILWSLRSEAQLRRVLQAMVLASVPVAIYGICQIWGLDPIPWGRPSISRPTAQAGNPIFLGAHLSMVIPVTLALGVEALWGVRRRTWRNRLVAAAYGGVLLLQIGVVISSQSRGPVLGFLAGLAFLALLALRSAPRWMAITGMSVMVGLVTFLTLVVVPEGPFEELRESPSVEWTGLPRFSQAFDFEKGTAAVRLLLWESMVELVREDPARLLVGYGPESILLTSHRHYRPGLSSLEGGELAADRAHNRTFDLVATRGLFAAVIDLLLLGGLLFVVLARLGVVGGAGGRWLLALSVAAGAVVGACIPLAVGRWGLAGPLVPVGAVAGLIAFLALDLLRGRSPTPEVGIPVSSGLGRVLGGLSFRNLLLMALGAAALVHFVETQVGIETVTTRLYLWTGAALVAVIGLGEPGERKQSHGLLESGGVEWGLIVALTLASATFGFVGIPRPISSPLPVLFLVVSGTWLVGILPVAGGDGKGLKAYALASLPVFFVLLACQLLWPYWTGQTVLNSSISLQELMAQVDRLSYTLPMFTGMVFLMVIIFGMWRARESIDLGWRIALYLWPFIILPLVCALPLKPSRADVYAHIGRSYEARGAWSPAAYLYAAASELEPHEPALYAHLARMNLEVAKEETGDPGRRQQALDAAVKAGVAARDRRPQDPRFLHLLGSLETDYGLLTPDGETVSMHFRLADQAFGEAVEAGSRIPATWVAWGQSYLHRGDPQAALQRLQRAQELDPDFPPTSRLQGEAYLSLGEWAAARDAYLRALELNSRSASNWRGLGSAYAQLDARAESAEAYLKAIERGASDVLTYRNLALMLGEMNQLSRAISYAERAVEVAPPAVEAEVRRLLEQLRELSVSGVSADTTGSAGSDPPLL